MTEPPYLAPQPGLQAASPRKAFPLWLVVFIAMVAIVGLIVLAFGALGFHSYRKFVRASKMAEARMNVGLIARHAAQAYDRDGALCPSASQPVPLDLSSVKGKKYLSSPADWESDQAANAGFACLGFSVSDPQYYQYDYQRTGAGATGSSFRAHARGDLDGDGVPSMFTLEGRVAPGGVLTISPSLIETHPEE